jgi:hypothetical protein
VHNPTATLRWTGLPAEIGNGEAGGSCSPRAARTRDVKTRSAGAHRGHIAVRSARNR